MDISIYKVIMKVDLGYEGPSDSVKILVMSGYGNISLGFEIWTGESITEQPIRMRI